MDYVWVSVALLGLFAAVATSRKTSAENLKYWAEGRVKSERTNLVSALRFGVSGAVCRSFTRTEFSPQEPEFTRFQKEYGEQCEWFKKANEKLLGSIENGKVIRPETIGVPPPRGGDNFAVTNFEQAASSYNEAVVEFDRVSEAALSTSNETSLAIIAPVLFAVAIALRLAKVTGEIRHEGTG